MKHRERTIRFAARSRLRRHGAPKAYNDYRVPRPGRRLCVVGQRLLFLKFTRMNGCLIPLGAPCFGAKGPRRMAG
jgi:hypothetical protein